MPDDRLCGLIVLAPDAPRDDAFVKDAFRLIRMAGPPLEKSAARGGAALLTVSRLEGTFGLTGLGAESVSAAGALAGMAKTAGHEWPEVHCKSVDLAPGFDSLSHAAELIVDELFRRGPVEVALTPEGRSVVELVPAVKRGAGRAAPDRHRARRSGCDQRRGARRHRGGRGRPGRVVRDEADPPGPDIRPNGRARLAV